MPISNKPWGQIAESDYSLEQWHKACILHLHDGAPTAKAECKLPVREPSGTLNRNGVHAAAGALAGARGGLDAPSAKKTSAAGALIRLYGEIGEQAPESIVRLSHEKMNAAIRRAAGR